jgi:hypothetical protein
MSFSKDLFTADPGGNGLPIRVGLRWELAAAAMEAIATGVGGERMKQQAASSRVAWCDEMRHGIEVLPRLFFGPSVRCLIEGLEAEGAVPSLVTRHTASVAGALLEKNGLHLRSIDFEIE